MKKLSNRKFAALLCSLFLGACADTVVTQPDRSVVNLDGGYVRKELNLPIEGAFDRTVKVFTEAGYKLEVYDRATGQISGRRTKKSNPNGKKGLAFHAVVIPAEGRNSILSIKILQDVREGSFFSPKRTEILITDPDMYGYIFRMVEKTNSDMLKDR